MNRTNFEQIAAHYIERFEEINNEEHAEYYKWQVCQRFRPLMDLALSAPAEEFSKALDDVRKCTENMIDSYTQPFYGLVDMTRKRGDSYPVDAIETVRRMFLDLYAVDGGDLWVRMKKIEKFFETSNELLTEYAPGSFLYKQDSHSVSAYLFLYDPEHHYMYKAMQSKAMADCIEFGDD